MKDIHGGNIWAMARKYGFRPEEMLDFSASINPLMADETIKDVILKNFHSLFHYPDPDYQELVDAMARFLGISHRNILVGNGSIEFIYLIPRILKPGRVLIPVPTFSEYEKGVRLGGATPEFIYGREEDLFSISARQIIDSLDGAKMIFLCNPNNPTGLVIEKDHLFEIIETCDKQGVWVIVDEAFIEFLDDRDDLTLIYEAVRKGKVMVLRSLTKSFCIPGLRVGYLIGDKETVKVLKNAQEPWRINSIAEAVGYEVIQDFEYLKRGRELIKEERDFLFSELGKIEGIKLFPSRANFILGALGRGGMDAKTLSENLAMRGILIRDLSNMRGLDGRFFRIAVRGRQENERLIEILRDIL